MRGGRPGAGWAVAARVETPFGPVDIGTGRDVTAEGPSERRLVRIDGHPVRGQIALAEHVALTWLTPQMDRLFIEGSGGRRRFLDRLVFGFDPAHAGRLSRYEHALRERGRLLRDGRGDDAWLSALEDEMATSGVAVAAARRDMVARLQQRVRAGGRAVSARRSGCRPARWRTGWTNSRPWRRRTICAAVWPTRAGSTASGSGSGEGGGTVGPHRSDLSVRHRTKNMPAEVCSTGEQKALLIAIILANARLMAAERGQPPLILLDEVAAHLDAERRTALFGEILELGAQAWLTGTDSAVFAELGDAASFFRVEDAHVTPA